jgi:cytochrome c peroxidase
MRMMSRHGFVLAVGLVAGSACVTEDATGEARQAEAQQAVALVDRATACSRDPRVVAGVVSVDTCVGADLFLRETFGGNGRSCATCHPVDHNFTIDPDFISKLPPTSPLFVAETNPNLGGLERPATMRKFGLILENVDGFAPDPTTHFVMRSVPHTLSLATSVARSATDPVTTPFDRTGWSGDGAPGNGALSDFQTGAITQHYTTSLARVAGTDFRLATGDELARIDTYMRGIGRSNELVLASVVMSDAGAEAGRTKFLSVGCNACHSNAGANAGFGDGGNRSFATGIEGSRSAALAGFPIDGGFGATPNADGSFGNRAFNVPPLIEAADTGPFFHTAVSISGASAHNTDFARTIEEAIAFYDSPAFNTGRAAPIDLTGVEIDNIGRFLRGLNATFNAALTVKRLDAELAIVARYRNTELAVQREMLRLANVELADAITDLAAVQSLNASSQLAFATAAILIEAGRVAGCSDADRTALVTLARQLVVVGSNAIGTNLSYTIGEGTVMF